MSNVYLLPMLPVKPLDGLMETPDQEGESHHLGFAYFTPLDPEIVRRLEDVSEGGETPVLALAWTSLVEPRQLLIEHKQLFDYYELDFSQEPRIVRLEDPIHMSIGKFCTLGSSKFQLEMTKVPLFAKFTLYHLTMFEKARLRLAQSADQDRKRERSIIATQTRAHLRLFDSIENALDTLALRNSE